MGAADFFRSARPAISGAELGEQRLLSQQAFDKQFNDNRRAVDVQKLLSDRQLLNPGSSLSPIPESAGFPSRIAGLPAPGAAPTGLQTPPQSRRAGAAPNNPVFESFMGTVQSGGLTNPHALAVLAAYGQHESGFTAANASGVWQDPSQSGKAGTAGGILSWRDSKKSKRLTNMRNFVAANGGDPNNPSPELQAQFFLNEDPSLVEKLNNVSSVEEANDLMRKAWQFAGFDKKTGETAKRLATAQSLLPNFMDILESASSTSEADLGPTSNNVLKAGLQTQSRGINSASFQRGLPNILSRLQSVPSASTDETFIAADGGTGIGDAAQTSLAANWFSSPQAAEYFGLNPEQLPAAQSDPLGFYNSFIGNDAVGLGGRFAGPRLGDDKITANEKALLDQDEKAKKEAEREAGLKASTEEEDIPIPAYISAVLKKPVEGIHRELEIAEREAVLMQQTAQRAWERLNARYQEAVFRHNVAVKTGSVDMLTTAKEELSAIQAESDALNVEYFSRTKEHGLATQKIHADLAIRDLQRGDPARMEQLWNFITNGNVRIQAREDGDFNVFTVSSDGEQQGAKLSYQELSTMFMQDSFKSSREAAAQSASVLAEKILDMQIDMKVEQQKHFNKIREIDLAETIKARTALTGYGAWAEDLQRGGLVAMAKDESHILVYNPQDLGDGLFSTGVTVVPNPNRSGLQAGLQAGG